MYGRTTIAGLLGLLLALAGSPSDFARAQDVKPIGKVVTAVGKVTIEHADATVVQARLSNDQAGAKVGDPVYRGDVVKTGADGRLPLVVGLTAAAQRCACRPGARRSGLA